MARQTDYSKYAGNRFSLRAKPSDQIKRIDSLSNTLGVLGDLLVSTWGGILMAIVTFFGLGGFMVFKAISANHGATLLSNIIPVLMIIVGMLLISLNVILTNPSFGSQLKISRKFLIKKIIYRKPSTKVDLKRFKFYDINQSVIETRFKNNPRYMVVYQVRGAVSPVTFKSELNRLAELNQQLLQNIEKNVIVTTVNSIQTAIVKPKKLPENATDDMIRRRNLLYKVVSTLPKNQQLKTLIFLTANTPDELRARTEVMENVFRRGLVISYWRLTGKDAKEGFQLLYGELSKTN